MDYGQMSRRELQALCKEHGIPANKTNVFMAEALGALNVPKETQVEPNEEAIADPAEVAKAKAKRTARSKKIIDVAADEIEILSSNLAQSSLTCDSFALGTGELAEGDAAAAVQVPEDDELMVEASSEVEIVTETAKVRRKPRTQATRKGVKPVGTVAEPRYTLEAANDEEIFESTLDVLPTAVDTWKDLEMGEVGPEGEHVFSTYSRRMKSEVHLESEIEVGAEDEVPFVSESVFPAHEEDVPAESLVPSLSDSLAGEQTVDADAKPVGKKSKAKGKKSKKVKAGAPVTSDIPEHGSEVIPILDECSLITVTRAPEAFKMPDSPAFGLALEADVNRGLQPAVTGSPSLEDHEFEFLPVPESIAEIMTPREAIPARAMELLAPAAAKECQHRVGRKPVKGCRSCASERKVATIMNEMLQSMDKPEDTSPLEVCADEFQSTAEVPEVVPTTPVKQGDEKENSLKNIDLHSLSIRKLQKEVQKRGLSKRGNTRTTKA